MSLHSEDAPRRAARRRRRTSEEIMDRLLRAAEEEFEAFGYAGATTAAIARRAEVTEAQLFRCFRSKAALFREAIFKPLDRHFMEFNARHLGSAHGARRDREIARLYITELQQFIARHRGMLIPMVMARTYARGAAEEVAEIASLRAYFDRGAALLAEDGAPATDARLIVRVSFAAVLANVMFKDWLFPAGLASDVEIQESVIDFVIQGLERFQPG